MTSAADTQLLNELDWLSVRAAQMVARIHERLNDTEPAPPEFNMLMFLSSERELRDRLEEARKAAERLRAPSASEHEEQRSRDALVIRKAILAIELQVARLAGMLEALL